MATAKIVATGVIAVIAKTGVVARAATAMLPTLTTATPRRVKTRSNAPAAVNRLELEGTVCRAPDVRYSAAGIPISRFAIEHRSTQAEAGLHREVYCRIGVVASGTGLEAQVKRLAGSSRVRVQGFLDRTTNRLGEPRLVLHAVEIELID